MLYLLLGISILIPQGLFRLPQRFKGYGHLAFIIRRTLIAMPYVLWLTYISWPPPNFDLQCVAALLVVTVGLLVSEGDAYKLKASCVYAQVLGPLKSIEMVCSIYNLILFLLAEEVFFRLTLLTIFENTWGVIFQAILFVAAHRLSPWGKSFTKNDIARQFIFSIGAGTYFLLTHDLVFCISAHLLLNSAEFILLWQRHKLKKINEDISYELV
jgi:membrane protease YdiL (CAAX protease family)